MLSLPDKIFRFLSASFMVMLLVSCQTPAPAPVSDRPQPPTNKILHHIVGPGETLYAIAWRYELDVQKLAGVNGLQQPYQIRSGQKLLLDVTKAPLVIANDSTRGTVGSPGVTAYPVEKSTIPRAEPPPTKINTPEQPPLPSGKWAWQWPAKGRVAREYDASKMLKGISIYTDAKTAVVAAAPGIVVYAGEGLRGYGRLIIVKHSDKYLSAYAHNHKILVKENDSVAQAQQIAEVGVDSANRHRLYFEIRENGTPVDPVKLLPN